jgi:DNA-binding response OmpR family regulator
MVRCESGPPNCVPPKGNSGMKRTVELDLRGRRVLVVEDEALVAMLLEDMLGDLGCEVLGPAMRVREAMDILNAATPMDVAILDVNLAGERSFKIAEALQSHAVPFVISTGFEGGIEEGWRDRPILRKPFMSNDLEAALRAALGREAAV